MDLLINLRKKIFKKGISWNNQRLISKVQKIIQLKKTLKILKSSKINLQLKINLKAN